MNALQKCRWYEFDSGAALEQAASRFILETAERAIVARGAFRIVLAGGDTPRKVYQALCTAHTDWLAWHIYFGDERCLPADHPDRNSRMARTAWLDHVAIPSLQIHPIPAELGPETAAADYALDVAEVEKFDLVLLGLGEDGHTASLFPGKDWGEAEDASPVLAVHDAPKMPSDRVTLSARRLSETQKVLFLVTGNSKREAMNRLVAGERIPASSIRPESGIDIYTDLPLPSDTVFHSQKSTHN
jgi:6-phosphogluconolactonase